MHWSFHDNTPSTCQLLADFTAISLVQATIILSELLQLSFNLSLLISAYYSYSQSSCQCNSLKPDEATFLQNKGSPIWEWNQSPPRSLTFTKLPLTHCSCSSVFPGTTIMSSEVRPLHWLFPLPPKLWDSHMINCLSNFGWSSNVILNKVYPVLNCKLLLRHSWRHSCILPSPCTVSYKLTNFLVSVSHNENNCSRRAGIYACSLFLRSPHPRWLASECHRAGIHKFVQ